jgi:hypothetical protein
MRAEHDDIERLSAYAGRGSLRPKRSRCCFATPGRRQSMGWPRSSRGLDGHFANVKDQSWTVLIADGVPRGVLVTFRDSLAFEGDA